MKIIRKYIRGIKNLIKSLFKEFGDEAFQVAIIHRIMGRESMTEKNSETKTSLAKTFSGIFHQFSDEDEVEWSQLLNFIGPDDEQKFLSFVKTFTERDFDEDIFRVRLVKSWQKDKESTKKTLVRIIALDGDYVEQEKLALGKKLLAEKNPLKKFVHFILNNKLSIILWTIFGIMLILVILKKIFS